MRLIKMTDENNLVRFICADKIWEYHYEENFDKTVIHAAGGYAKCPGNKCPEITDFLLHESDSNKNASLVLK